MNDSAECEFVQWYIRKAKRKRLLYELTAEAKRYDGLSRFCHQAEDLLEPSRIHLQGTDLKQDPAFLDFMRRQKGTCRILSPNRCLDGQDVPVLRAVEMAVQCLDAAILIGDSFAVVFSEAEKGGRKAYFLRRQPVSAQPF